MAGATGDEEEVEVTGGGGMACSSAAGAGAAPASAALTELVGGGRGTGLGEGAGSADGGARSPAVGCAAAVGFGGGPSVEAMRTGGAGAVGPVRENVGSGADTGRGDEVEAVVEEEEAATQVGKEAAELGDSIILLAEAA